MNPAQGRDVFVGRQPIYDRNLELYAYELLFRNGDVSEANVVDGDQATFTVILNALVEIGLSRLVGDRRAFVNLTRNSVLCEYAQFFPQDRVVMEVLEDVTVDQELLEMVYKFSSKGYEIALDDFVYREELRPLLDVAGIVKIDVKALDRDDVRAYVERFGNLKLLAEKVETEDDFRFCRDLGFDLYQGWFLGKPKVMKVRHVPTSQLATLRLLSAIHETEGWSDRVAELVSMDPTLTYRLARSINPEVHGSVLESAAQAVQLLGRDQLKHWITLLCIAGHDDVDPELMLRSMVRGRFLSGMSGAMAPEHRHRWQMVGQLSLIPELVGGTKHELLDSLALHPTVARALLWGEGPAGVALGCVPDLEAGRAPSHPLLATDEVSVIWQDACAWAGERRTELGF